VVADVDLVVDVDELDVVVGVGWISDRTLSIRASACVCRRRSLSAITRSCRASS